MIAPPAIAPVAVKVFEASVVKPVASVIAAATLAASVNLVGLRVFIDDETSVPLIVSASAAKL